MKSLVVLPACCILLASAYGQESALAKKVRAIDEQWSKAASAHKLEATLSYYSDDAVLLAPNAPIMKTKKDIRAAWAELTAPTSAVSWTATKVEVAKSGDIAYMYGTYDLSLKGADGKTIKDHGKFVEVWKKQKGGAWKCCVDMFNSDLPAS